LTNVDLGFEKRHHGSNVIGGLAMRKSEMLGLSVPYDWSNSNIQDGVLISLVLEKHRFEDVARVCSHYGLTRVRGLAGEINDPYLSRMLARMLKNIERGFGNAKGRGSSAAA
jgi:hypothetical protein